MTHAAVRIRELCASDAEAYADLLDCNKPTWANTAEIQNSEARSHYLLNSSLLRVFAAEADDGHLRMSISARLWTELPNYTIVDFKTRTSLDLKLFKSMFSDLVGTMIAACENEGRFEFWYLIEDKEIYRSRSKRSGRNVMQYLVPSLANYTLFDEARFEPNELPKWALHVSMMMNQTVSAPTVLRRGIHSGKLGRS